MSPQGGLKERIVVAVLHLRKMPSIRGPGGWEGGLSPRDRESGVGVGWDFWKRTGGGAG